MATITNTIINSIKDKPFCAFKVFCIVVLVKK